MRGLGVMSAATAQVNHLMVPQSIRYEHDAVIELLAKEAARPGVASAVAQRLLVRVKAHFAKEEEFVFPPLGLLDQIEVGDMPTDSVRKAVIEMAARTEAAKDDLEQEHLQIFSMTQELIEYATRASEPELKSFASDVAAHSLQAFRLASP
jgi:hemerythrin